MRLVCPNCDATYEVPDSVIPSEGRDVQCSNCGTSWFFNPNAPIEPEPQSALEPEPVTEPQPDLPADPVPEPPEEAIESEAEPDPEPVAEPETPEKPEKRTLDAQVADVLRQEAEYEARARAEEAGLEYQDDLPLDDPPDPPVTDSGDDPATGTGGSRRDLLPDIDEINSTLRATSDRKTAAPSSAEETATVQTQRRGFRIGFGVMLLLLGALAALYSYAGPLSESVPSLASPLSGFVETVNGGRLWLQNAMEALADGIES
ncbi:MAG: zinc-ribbon domain-containing protein [Pseudomonadota bacterium]